MQKNYLQKKRKTQNPEKQKCMHRKKKLKVKHVVAYYQLFCMIAFLKKKVVKKNRNFKLKVKFESKI